MEKLTENPPPPHRSESTLKPWCGLYFQITAAALLFIHSCSFMFRFTSRENNLCDSDVGRQLNYSAFIFLLFSFFFLLCPCGDMPLWEELKSNDGQCVNNSSRAYAFCSGPHTPCLPTFSRVHRSTAWCRHRNYGNREESHGGEWVRAWAEWWVHV